MGPAKAKIHPRHVHLTIKHGPKPTDFQYEATVKGRRIDNPKELKLDRGETINFESPNTFSLRFIESPFEHPEKTVLQATSAGDGWTISGVVRDDAVYHHWYHYTVIMGDFSTDDPEIILEQVNE